MRIAITNWSDRFAGGAEQYLSEIVQHLLARGHQLAFWHQFSAPSNSVPLPFTSVIPSYEISSLGLPAVLETLCQWRPDVIYCHGMVDPEIEAAILRVAPSVFFAHNYHGTCLSGGKVQMFPKPAPCTRQFGIGCLAQFYPKRCGGLNPVTLLQDYRRTASRLRILRQYDQVITHSQHLADEYRRHGVECEAIRFCISVRRDLSDDWQPSDRWRLLMMGRMAISKGGELLLEALPRIAERLTRPVELTIAGDGPARKDWENRADQVRKRNPAIQIHFPGWLSGEERETALRKTDLLLLPSLWPEPFGLIGPEAGLRGIPAVAFSVGGIPGWLHDGVNGCLAPSKPLTAADYAAAVVRCLSDESLYRSMRTESRRLSMKMTVDAHYQDLIRVFEAVIRNPRFPRSHTA